MTQTAPQNHQAVPVSSAEMVRVSPDVAFESYRKGLEPFDLEAAFKLSEVLARTGYCGVQTPEEALSRIMFGRELGLTAMNSLRAVYIVNGRPGLDANVMYALCLQFKECEYFEPVESTATKATFRAKRKGRDEFVLSWTIEQAIQAGLVNGAKEKDNWKNYPENMLRARCISNLARMLFPEPINGMHTVDEIETSTMSVPTVTVVNTSPAPAPAAVKEATNESDKIEEGFLTRINALPATGLTPEQKAEKTAVRAEIAKAKDMNVLSGPWYARVVAAYMAKFPVAKKSPGAPTVTQQPGGAVPPPAAAAPAAPPPAAAAPPPPPPAPPPAAAAPAAPPAPPPAPPAPASDTGDEADLGSDNPDDY